MAKSKSKPARVKPKPQAGAYVMMLFVSLVAAGMGCTFLYLDNDEYSAKTPPKEAAPVLPRLGDEPKAGGSEPPAAKETGG